VSAEPIKVDLGAGIGVWFDVDPGDEMPHKFLLNEDEYLWLTEEQAAAIGAKRPERWGTHTLLGVECAFTSARNGYARVRWEPGASCDDVPLAIWAHAVPIFKAGEK
jgi:hypothetical protein